MAAVCDKPFRRLLLELGVAALSAVCGLRIDLPRAFEMVETGVVLADADSVFMVRTSSCSSSSIAIIKPSLPFHVLKRLDDGLKQQGAVEAERWTELKRS